MQRMRSHNWSRLNSVIRLQLTTMGSKNLDVKVSRVWLAAYVRRVGVKRFKSVQVCAIAIGLAGDNENEKTDDKNMRITVFRCRVSGLIARSRILFVEQAVTSHESNKDVAMNHKVSRCNGCSLIIDVY